MGDQDARPAQADLTGTRKPERTIPSMEASRSTSSKSSVAFFLEFGLSFLNMRWAAAFERQFFPP